MESETILSPPVWERYPNIDIDADNRFLYEGFLARELRVPKCNACGRWFMPHRAICPHCWSFDVTPVAVGGRGRVHLLMVLSQGVAAPGVVYPLPVATIELEEQAAVRFTSTIIGCPIEEMRIDMPVELEWTDRGGAPFPAFRPRRQGDGA